MERCDAESPWVLSRYLNSAFGELEDHVFVEPDETLLIFHAQVQRWTDVTGLNQFTCITSQQVEVTRPEGLVQVSVSTSHQDWSPDNPHAEDCPPARLEIEDIFYDARTTKELLRITRPGGAGAAEVALDGNVVSISAGTCHAEVVLHLPAHVSCEAWKPREITRSTLRAACGARTIAAARPRR
jgi:hypothetical protein